MKRFKLRIKLEEKLICKKFVSSSNIGIDDFVKILNQLDALKARQVQDIEHNNVCYYSTRNFLLTTNSETNTKLSYKTKYEIDNVYAYNHKTARLFISHRHQDLPILHCALQQGSVLQPVLCYHKDKALEQSSCFQFLLAKE